MDVARFKQLTGVSRKYAIPLLEYLDRQRITIKQNDQRLILRNLEVDVHAQPSCYIAKYFAGISA